MLKELINNKKQRIVQGIENIFKLKLIKLNLTLLIIRVLSKNKMPAVKIKVKRNLRLEFISYLSSTKPNKKKTVQKIFCQRSIR